MKKIIAGIALAAVLSPMNGIADEITDAQLCTLMALSAKRTMEARQTGMPLSQYLELTENMPLPDAFKSFIKELALEAYDSPRFSTNEHRIRVITEFENQVLVGCLKGLK